MFVNLSPKKQQEATSPEAIIVLMTFALWVLCCVWTSDGLDSVTDMMLPWLLQVIFTACKTETVAAGAAQMR